MKATWKTPMAALAAAACGLLLAASQARANPLPMPSIEATQEPGSQNVSLAIRIAGSTGCPMGTVYRGKLLVESTGYDQELDRDDADTVVVSEVTSSQFTSTPDSWSSGVSHCTLSITDVCVEPGTYYYQMFSGDSAATWIDTQYEDDSIVVQELDAACLPKQGACSISSIPGTASGLALLAAVLSLFAAFVLLGRGRGRS